MPEKSSNAVEWFTQLEPVERATPAPQRPDDPRLGEIVEVWNGDSAALRPGRAVLVGFPQDEGVRRNHGRPGAALAPKEIRTWLSRLTPWDAQSDADLALDPPLDVGNIRIAGSLEESQEVLGTVVGGVLARDAVPIVLGGGHETAFGHYQGYVRAARPVGIVNLDAHLDVRPLIEGKGHSGSPFRQAMEHPKRPLPGHCYACVGAQPYAVSRAHWQYVRERGCRVRWAPEVQTSLTEHFWPELGRLAGFDCQVYVSIDADVVNASEVPGVSAPNVAGLSGTAVLECARLAGQFSAVASLDVVEVSPALDRDGVSARWAALAVWNFLVGLRLRAVLRST